MGGKYVFDIESNGLLDATKVHSLVLRDIESGKVTSCADQVGFRSIQSGLGILSGAEMLVGHNVLCFDLPLLRKIFPDFKPEGRVVDTLVISRLVWTDIKERDFSQARRGFPGYLIGSHSLKAWGFRLGCYKGNFNETTDWRHWTPQMQEYCEQDTLVTLRFWQRIQELNYSQDAIELEHEFQKIIFEQEQFGWKFDESKAEKLYQRLLTRKEELTSELQKVFPPEEIQLKTKVKYVPFNPGSRDQIAKRLMEKGWKPVHTTETGKPQVSDEILESITTIKEAKLLAEYQMINKRCGQLGSGDKAWLKMVKRGRLHGRMITNGAVTGRCTHMDPNLAQVPAVGVPFGEECRSLFITDPGFVLVGADASGLELRCLAHYMAQWDGGSYSKIVCEGDVHTENQQAAGLESRNQAKTFISVGCV